MYFRNLDGLRFIAAMFVIIGHCQSILYNHYHIRTYSPWGEKLANFGVDFFFVLSGFLISYLLLKELHTTGKIAIKKFYIRRMLRLWPLYFLVGIFALVTSEPILRWLELADRSQMPIEWLANFAYLFTFSINFQILNGHANMFSSPTLGHFWSLSVEEQFYLFFAPALYFSRKNPLVFIVFMILIGWLFTSYKFDFYKVWYDKNAWAASNYFTLSRFFHFGLGALMAWIVLEVQLFKQFFQNKLDISFQIGEKKVQLLLLLSNKYVIKFVQLCLLIPMCRYLFGHYFFDDTIERILNGWIAFGIVLIAIIPFSILPFEVKVLKYFGKISFGIYIFHLFAIHVVLKLLLDSGFEVENTLFQFLFPFFSAILAVIIATLSYEKIEKPILKFKERFE